MFALKGWFGEKTTQLGMWIGLDGDTYRRIHNLILPAQGGTTQIDHVLVSLYGIFVIETKNMSGWIFGNERSPKWTQSIYGQKFQFQNPLHQNYRHTKALEEFLNLPESCFHPIVFFIGECELKTDLPANVLTRGLGNYIKSDALGHPACKRAMAGHHPGGARSARCNGISRGCLYAVGRWGTASFDAE